MVSEPQKPQDTVSESDDDDDPPIKYSKYSQLQLSSNQLYPNFLNMSRDLIAQIEGARKRQLMNLKTSSKSLHFADMPEHRQDQLAFTPQRKSREIIPASTDEYDIERDSVASQSSRSISKHLQQKIKVVGTKQLADCTEAQVQEWMEQTFKADMLKAGDFEDVHSKRESIG